ncbi:histidine phosphatase family protein [Staphylococcus sp. SQ8-PEA]|uniref:Histidine phosphatase family protein n=1 Tax=Staphylococcus marylandisciuri TaxID=2981529 RepID=A0ABT2QRQ5_9STAP|nr:histidine phosphatase family protein [Staphylococcus marylandisciuri]MCU5746650.1 histidine phosphatase family protein [Staphylococcus marylandisciuri]
MPRICFVRHGETDWNKLGKLQGRTDTELNVNGKEQALECAQALQKEEWDAIYSSPLQRAYKTASIVADYIDAPHRVMEELVERSFGKAESMTVKERLSAYPDRQYPNQEDETALKDRLICALNHIKEEYPEGNVLVVTHGAVINFLLSQLCLSKYEIPPNSLVNGSLSYIISKNNDWYVEDFNVTDHLSYYNEIGKV